MGRPPGEDLRKAARVIEVLREAPQGLWLREIAKRAGIHPTTVANYANSLLSPILDDVILGRDEKPILRVLKLKDEVLERIEKGEAIEDILNTLVMIKYRKQKI